MKKYLTEQEILEKLDIPDWRHMSKNKVTAFISSLPYMEQEVAIAAIEQFPNFVDLSKTIVTALTDSYNVAIDHIAKSHQHELDDQKRAIDSLDNLLNQSNISDAVRIEAIHAMVTISNTIAERSDRYERRIYKIQKTFTYGLGVVAVLAAGVIGYNVISQNNDNDNNVDCIEDNSND